MSHRIQTSSDPRDLPGDFRHRVDLEVRFRDTDAMGHVNNAVYHTYVEHGRVRYLRAAGGHVLRRFILAEARMVHRSPVFFGEIVTVETRVTRIGRTSLDMEHRLTVAAADPDAPARLVAVATSTLVQYDYDRAIPVPVPDASVADLEAFEGHRLREAAPAAAPDSAG